jgi:hypothetical protein
MSSQRNPTVREGASFFSPWAYNVPDPMSTKLYLTLFNASEQLRTPSSLAAETHTNNHSHQIQFYQPQYKSTQPFTMPRPLKKASLPALPAELTQQVCESLGLADLLSLRSTDMARANMTIRSLTPLFASKLKRSQVLRTREDLLTLYGLLSVPEWRNCVESIEFVNHGLYDIRRMEIGGDRNIVSPWPRWLGRFALTSLSVEHIQRDVAPAQLDFEDGDGDEASILDKIFAYLQQAEKLEAIHTGLVDGEKHPLLGSGLCSAVCALEKPILTRA